MLIKQVIIHGFKTFAHKTQLLFDPGITAIVGPNGSGKSNIVDSVRWCLGEQSFSLLRSKKTSDVIFSGSDKRARLGMAQVSLTLDNSKGELPIDFAEVEITRRAYRDGDNEYLLNGKRVRLQDITDLLAHTGLGKQTYAVVGQGLIDKVLSLSPEERRSLFEEAAGITGYQAKRARTLRQLEATQQNLTRVQDIVAELSPRLGYLRRQAERAREREQVANDLRGLLRIWYGYRWHSTLERLGEQRTAEQRLNEIVRGRQQSLRTLGQQIEQLRQQQVLLRADLGKLHGESSILHSQAEKVTRDLAVCQERLRQTQGRQEEIQREIVPLQLQVETTEQRLAELSTTLESVKSEVEQRQITVQMLQRELMQRQQERERLQDALTSARNHLTDLQTQQADRRSRLDQMAERRHSLCAEQESLQQSLQQAQRELDALRQDLHRAEEAAVTLSQELAQWQNQQHELDESLKGLRSALQQAESHRQVADRHVDQLQTRLDLLSRLRSEGAGYASGVRAVLQASAQTTGSTRLHGIVGTVAALVQVPLGLDLAIETALGAAIQNIVTERWDDARAAIDMLQKTGRGRATFLPLDRLSVLPDIVAPTVPGLLGNAAHLVEYDARLREVVSSLLGRTWIADDLAVARRALDNLVGGPRPTLVTIGGEIVRPGGAVTGGRDGNRRDESILARERELRDLPPQIRAAQEQAQASVTQCHELHRQIEEQQLHVETIQQTCADLSRAERQQQQAVAEVRRRLDRAQQTVQWQTAGLAQATAELTNLAAQESEFQTQLAGLEQAQSAARVRLTEAEAAVDVSEASELLQQLADLRAAAAEAQGTLRSQHSLQENQHRTLQSTRDQIRNKERRIAELTAEAARLQEESAQLSRHEETLRQQIAEYQIRMDPVEARLAALGTEQSGAESRERHYQQVLRQDESAWNSAQLRLQRTEDALTQLRHDIEQDMGLVLLEQREDQAYQPPLPLEAVVEQLPVEEELPEGLEDEIKEMRARLGRVSNVNPDAPREYEEAARRHEFLLTESQDLAAAIHDLRTVIRELDELMEVELRRTFTDVAKEFEHFFKMLFNGGTARLVLTTPEDINNTGVDIIARPPGKRPQSLALLSGGERALSAMALIFSILSVSPTPFCILDEVDAALDEANVDRFRQTVESLTGRTQFIIVTHNRRTLEGANAIYGITMGDDGISKMISLRFEGDTFVQSDGGDDREQLHVVEELVRM